MIFSRLRMTVSQEFVPGFSCQPMIFLVHLRSCSLSHLLCLLSILGTPGRHGAGIWLLKGVRGWRERDRGREAGWGGVVWRGKGEEGSG